MRATFTFILSTMLVFLMGQDTFARKKPLKLFIKKDNIDLASRTIHFKLNRPADSAEIKVFNLDGELLAERLELYDGAAAGTDLSISWPTLLGDADNFKIEMKVTDTNEFWLSWEIIKFYGVVPHEEVVFESGKHEIRPSEAPKLDEALPKILEMVRKFKKFGGNMSYGLYVAGHTDTVGKRADNAELSKRRARSIAKYFIAHGLKNQKISIYIRGFGEEALAVKTKDSVDEERNRRADYIISNFPPQIPGPGGWVKIK